MIIHSVQILVICPTKFLRPSPFSFKFSTTNQQVKNFWAETSSSRNKVNTHSLIPHFFSLELIDLLSKFKISDSKKERYQWLERRINLWNERPRNMLLACISWCILGKQRSFSICLSFEETFNYPHPELHWWGTKFFWEFDQCSDTLLLRRRWKTVFRRKQRVYGNPWLQNHECYWL